MPYRDSVCHCWAYYSSVYLSGLVQCGSPCGGGNTGQSHCMCGYFRLDFHDMLGSSEFTISQRPKTLNSTLGGTCCAPKSTLTVTLDLLGLHVRCISSYYRRANDAPWIWAHLKRTSRAFSGVLLFPSVLVPYAIRWVSSTYPFT